MKQIVCYGDSNTWGLIPGTQERYPWGVRWTSLLQEKLGTSGFRIIEEGLPGRTTIFDDPSRENRNGLKTLPLVLETCRPLDGAVIMLGTNDCKPCYQADPVQIADGLESCLKLLLDSVPAEGVLLIIPPPLGPSVWRPGFDPEFDRASVGKTRRLEDTYRQVAGRLQVRLISARNYASASGMDQEHLTPQGHAALAEAVYREISDMFIR